MARVAVGGSGSEALLAGAVARDHPLPAVRGVTADMTLADSVLPEVRVLAALPGTSLHWRLRADPEITYWETGGPPVSQVMVTATGFVDASAWQTHGGLAGLGPDGFAQGGMSDGMYPGPLLEVLTEQAVTGSPRFAPLSAPHTMPPDAAAAAADSAAAGAADSAAAGAGSLAGIPGVPGAEGVRRLTDDEVLGAMSAARRLRNRAEWLELSALAEFTRRRYAEREAAVASGDPVGQRAGEFAGEEVAYQTVCSGRAADERMELAAALAARLPATFERMGGGAIDSYQALITHRATRDLSQENAAIADAILAAEAPFLTPEALRRRAAQVTMTLDPDAAAKRKKQGARHKRVEMWAEESGNAAIAGREMKPADALAASAYYDALARALRKGGVPGTLRELRHLAFTDRNTGKDPLDRLAARDGGNDPGQQQDADPPTGPAPHDPGEGETREADPGEGDGTRTDGLRDDGYRDDEPWDHEPGDHEPWDDGDDNRGGDDHGGDAGKDDNGKDEDSRGGGNGGEPAPAGPAETGNPAGGATAPVPANITILVPAGTLLGWSGAPGQVSGLGPLDPQTTRDLLQAASRHPRTRWCVTLTGPDGTAVGHGCAPGRHIWPPPGAADASGRAGPAPPQPPGPAEQPGRPAEQPGRAAEQAGRPAERAGRAERADAEERAAGVTRLLDWLGVVPEPIARGSCDHRHQEDRYTPSRKLGHLIRARTATCPAPGCGARAEFNDLDHTVPWPQGPTDECDLSPTCRRHHRVKQAPGWKLEQPQPGIMRWTTPSDRVYTTRPTRY